MDHKPIFLSVTKKYNLAGYEEFYIKLYTKQGMYFGYWTDVYLLQYLQKAKDDI